MVRSVVVFTVVAAIAVASSGCQAVGGGEERRVRLPAAFPRDVPLPEGAHLRSGQDRGDRGINLVFETDEPASTVAERLRSRLEAGGWLLLSEVVADGAVFISYRQGARSLAFGISRTGGVTMVGLAYHQPGSGAEGVQG